MQILIKYIFTPLKCLYIFHEILIKNINIEKKVLNKLCLLD